MRELVIRRKLTEQEIQRLKIIAETKNIKRACDIAGVSTQTWRNIHNGMPTKVTTIDVLISYARLTQAKVNQQSIQETDKN